MLAPPMKKQASVGTSAKVAEPAAAVGTIFWDVVEMLAASAWTPCAVGTSMAAVVGRVLHILGACGSPMQIPML